MSQAFDALCEFLRRSSGLVMEQSKRYLVESRVMPIVRRERLSSLDELVALIQKGQSPKLAKDVIEAMTINETYFFRDKQPFDQFRNFILPKVIAARQNDRRIRIWSAAASTGQEGYSLAMILDEMASRIPGWRVEIVGTDLAEPVLEKARKGIYSQFEVQRGLPTPMLLKHFTQIGDSWQISEAMRQRVTFRQLNLLQDFNSLGRFDIIFCRNVLIYFDAMRKQDILSRMCRILSPEGFLMLGASESLIGLKTDLVPHSEQRSVFVLQGAAGASTIPGIPVSAPAPAASATPKVNFPVTGAAGASFAAQARMKTVV